MNLYKIISEQVYDRVVQALFGMHASHINVLWFKSQFCFRFSFLLRCTLRGSR